LFDLGADLCVPLPASVKTRRLRITAAAGRAVERAIDRLNEALTPLQSFVLPGGVPRRRGCIWRALCAGERNAAS